MTQRQTCPHCLRPLKTCLCQWVKSVANQVEVIILQHPLESREVKNTARLLYLCLNTSQLHIGEKFDAAFFIGLGKTAKSSIYDLLLYPDTPEERSIGINSPPLLDLAQLEDRSTRLRLWVIDATWRKSRKMLYLNPELQSMPRLNLRNPPASLYSIRKSHSENQLSTLEASCYALQQLEHNRVDYTPVLTAFAAFIQQQQTFMPPL